MDRLHARMQALLEREVPVVLGGDYNVIPEPLDCYDPRAWEGDALFRPESRAACASAAETMSISPSLLAPKTSTPQRASSARTGREMRSHSASSFSTAS